MIATGADGTDSPDPGCFQDRIAQQAACPMLDRGEGVRLVVVGAIYTGG